MKRVITVAFIFVCCLFLWCSAFAAETTGKESSVLKKDEGKSLFEKKCSQCHAADRIKEAHHTKEDLKNILERMTSKPACNISPLEKRDIQDYIFKNMGDLFPGSPIGAPVPGM